LYACLSTELTFPLQGVYTKGVTQAADGLRELDEDAESTQADAVSQLLRLALCPGGDALPSYERLRIALGN
jgi:hypothetical protein